GSTRVEHAHPVEVCEIAGSGEERGLAHPGRPFHDHEAAPTLASPGERRLDSHQLLGALEESRAGPRHLAHPGRAYRSAKGRGVVTVRTGASALNMHTDARGWRGARPDERRRRCTHRWSRGPRCPKGVTSWSESYTRNYCLPSARRRASAACCISSDATATK